jgi:HlyD family secretion protein
VLFVIANDLTHMQVNASIDEADIGRVRVGQDVTFSVDAFPDETFRGRVEQVRLQPVTNQNVVTYNTIISVENPGLRLMPGMTATVSVIVRNRQNVLRVPTAALRFRPEGYEEPRPGGGQAGPGGPGGAAGGSRGRPGGGGAAAGGGARVARRDGGGHPEASSAEAANRGGETQVRGRPGLVFVPGPDGQPKAAPVRLGISDGRFVEVFEGLDEGARVITGFEEPGRARPQVSASPSANPFQPQRFQPRTR